MTGTATEPHDGCPRWAAELIRRIYDLEVKLGNLRPTQAEWEEANVADLFDRVSRDEDADSQDETVVESLFVKVAKGLTDEGFEPARVASFVNARIRGGGTLPYCDAREVAEAARLRH